MRLSAALGSLFTTRKQSPSLLRVTQKTPSSLSTPRCTKSTYARSKMTISPGLTPAQTCAARMLSAALADSTKTKRGSRLCKSKRTWSLAAALRRRCSSPVDAGGNQGNRAGVHHVNDAPETPGQAFTSASGGKAGRKRLEVFKHRPEQPFGQRCVAVFIGVGKVVAAGRPCPAQ